MSIILHNLQCEISCTGMYNTYCQYHGHVPTEWFTTNKQRSSTNSEIP